MTEAVHPALPVLLLDFDGTICVGDAPVWAYAEALIADLLDGAAGAPTNLDADVRARLGAFLDGDPSSPSYLDGYAAVAELAADHAAAEQLERAYATSRRQLAEGSLDVFAPAGLADLLDELADRVERVLVTNAPSDGIEQTLQRIGLTGRIDRVITDADKPSGWSEILPPLLETRPAAAVLAVGDIWGNDLEVPLAAGCTTALIDRFGHRAGPAHVVASSFPTLYPAIRSWADDPISFADENAPRTPATA